MRARSRFPLLCAALAVALPFAAALGGCGSSSTADQCTTVPDPAAATYYSGLQVDLTSSTKTADGLYVRDIAVGVGAVVTAGQTVSVRYSGWLANGALFDSNASSSDPLSFVLGSTAVITGFSEGLVGIRVGGTRQLVLPPALGYGGAAHGAIPCNSILVFNIEVVKAQ